MAIIGEWRHLTPFRTEKLSTLPPMVLRKWESRKSPFLSKLRRMTLVIGVRILGLLQLLLKYMQKETIQERTRICSLDLDQPIIDYLKTQFDAYEASLGQKVRTTCSNYNHTCYLLPNCDTPRNIQEYEVFIEDMLRDKVREYVQEEHMKTEFECINAYYYYCCYPQNIFNPIPIGSFLFAEALKNERTRPIIKVVFLSKEDYVTYNLVNRYNSYESNSQRFSNYSHLPDLSLKSIQGTSVKLCDNNLSQRLFQAYLSDIHYNVAFQTPWTNDENNKHIDDTGFVPLLQTTTGAIVSFVYITKQEVVIGLPQTSKKKELLQTVFEELLFPHFSNYFPEVAETAWIKNPEY